MIMEIKERLHYFNYTFQHKKAFLRVEKEILGKNTLGGVLHET